MLTTLTTCPPLAGRECSTWGFISEPAGLRWQEICHRFRHLHVAVHLKRVGPMPMNPKLQLEFLLWGILSTADTEATSSCTALNPAWPCFHPGFVSYTTYHIPCSAMLSSSGARRKAPRCAGSGRYPLPTPSATQPVTASNARSIHNPLLLHKLNIQMPDPLLNNVVELGNETERRRQSTRPWRVFTNH